MTTTNNSLNISELGVVSNLGNGVFVATAPGSAGNVLTSDGSLWQSLPLSSPDPTKTIILVDDMLATNGQNTFLNWYNSLSNNFIDGTLANPGIIALTAGNGVFSLSSTNNNASFSLGNGVFNLNFVYDLVGLSSMSGGYDIYIGLFDTISGQAAQVPVDGVYFHYTDTLNSGNWTINSASSSTTTTANTSSLASTGFHNYGIEINANATSVKFTIDGVEVSNSPITTNITSAINLAPSIMMLNKTGTVADQNFDLFYLKKVLTTSR